MVSCGSFPLSILAELPTPTHLTKNRWEYLTIMKSRLPALRLGSPRSKGVDGSVQATDLFEEIVIRRIIGYIIDVAILFFLGIVAWVLLLIAGVLSFGLTMPMIPLAIALLPTAYHTWFIGSQGGTPGMQLMDLEVNSLEGGAPSYLQALIMTVLFYLSVAVTGWLILIVALFNDRRRTMHDFFSNTLVVRRSAQAFSAANPLS